MAGAGASAPELRRLATVALRSGHFGPAREALAELVKLTPKDPAAWRDLGGACRDLGRWDEAVTALRRASRLDPDAAQVRFALAACLAGLGRLGEAERLLRALAEPSNAPAPPDPRLWALARLAALRPAAISPAELSDMQAALTQPAPDRESLAVALGFGIAAVHEAAGRIDAAFDAYAAANAAQRAIFQARPGADPAAVLAAHRAAAAHVLAVHDAAPSPSSSGPERASAVPAPIFIVGAPRSGSSLVEQILAAHPDVQTLGETGVLPALLERAYPAQPSGAFSPSLGAIGRVYLDQLRARGWDGRRRFVDKTLENLLHLGAIRALFPDAVILHTSRDPRDAIVGIWRTRFASDVPTLYDLADIAAEIALSAETAQGWRQRLPGVLHDIVLEDLIAAPEAQIRALLAACGLPWRAACLTFWTAPSTVRTASAVQVREPLSAAGLGRWRRFAHRLPAWLTAADPPALPSPPDPD